MVVPYGTMFTLWLMWRNNKLLEQIRRNQLSPAERAQEDAAERAEAEAQGQGIAIVILIVIAILAAVAILHWLGTVSG
jgi:hypothetical protein